MYGVEQYKSRMPRYGANLLNSLLIKYNIKHPQCALNQFDPTKSTFGCQFMKQFHLYF